MHSKQINRETGKTLEKVISEFKKGIFHSCYLLYGEEEYLVKDATRKIIDHLIPDDCDRDFNLFYIDGDSQDIDGLCESLCTTPLIPARKVIVLRDTNIFQSKETIPEVIRKIRDCLDKDQAKAIRLFTTFIKLSGLTLTDLTDNRWQRIPDEEWQAITGSEEAGQREAWLPRIIDLCSRQGLDEHSARENTERLSDLLTRGLPAGHHLVITTDTVDKRKKLFKTISEVGIIINFDRIKGETRQKAN